MRIEVQWGAVAPRQSAYSVAWKRLPESYQSYSDSDQLRQMLSLWIDQAQEAALITDSQRARLARYASTSQPLLGQEDAEEDFRTVPGLFAGVITQVANWNATDIQGIQVEVKPLAGDDDHLTPSEIKAGNRDVTKNAVTGARSLWDQFLKEGAFVVWHSLPQYAQFGIIGVGAVAIIAVAASVSSVVRAVR